MKYFFILLFTAGMVACNSVDSKTTEEQAKAAMADSTRYTTIEWLDPVYKDLGKVPTGQNPEISWRFKNTGNKPLIIAEVRPGCGCTVADKPEAPIAPGKEGVIKATFNTKGQTVGTHDKSVTVLANTLGGVSHSLMFHVDITEK
jgi:hypothetical protein